MAISAISSGNLPFFGVFSVLVLKLKWLIDTCMVELESLAVSGHYQIIVKPNSSLTKRQGRMLFAATAVIILGIAAAFALLGVWSVLPFSGIETTIFAYCSSLTFVNTRVAEVITISDALVRVDFGEKSSAQIYEFKRPWVGLKLMKPE